MKRRQRVADDSDCEIASAIPCGMLSTARLFIALSDGRLPRANVDQQVARRPRLEVRYH
jgi:hypothetical protein